MAQPEVPREGNHPPAHRLAGTPQDPSHRMHGPHHRVRGMSSEFENAPEEDALSADPVSGSSPPGARAHAEGGRSGGRAERANNDPNDALDLQAIPPGDEEPEWVDQSGSPWQTGDQKSP